MDLELLQFGTEERRWGQCSPEDLLAAGGQLLGKALACCSSFFFSLSRSWPVLWLLLDSALQGSWQAKGKQLQS